MLRERWREPHILFIYAIKVAMHYHYSALAHALAQVDVKTGAMPDAGRSFSRAKRPAEAAAAYAGSGCPAKRRRRAAGRERE